jgi:hypothetical protein
VRGVSSAQFWCFFCVALGTGNACPASAATISNGNITCSGDCFTDAAPVVLCLLVHRVQVTVLSWLILFLSCADQRSLTNQMLVAAQLWANAYVVTFIRLRRLNLHSQLGTTFFRLSMAMGRVVLARNSTTAVASAGGAALYCLGY